MHRAVRARAQRFRRAGGGDAEELARQRETFRHRLGFIARLAGLIARVDKRDDRRGPGVVDARRARIAAERARCGRIAGQRQLFLRRAARQRQWGRRRRALPHRRERPHRRGIGVGRAPARALADLHQPRAQRGEARIVRRRQRHGARHLGEAARLRGEDQRARPLASLARVIGPPVARQDFDAAPQCVGQRVEHAPVLAARARHDLRHLRHAGVRHGLGAAREFGEIGLVELAALAERRQRLDPLAQLLADEQPRIVRAQRQFQHIAEPLDQRSVHRLARLLGGGQEGIGPGRQRDIAARPRPEGDEAVRVDARADRVHRVAHVA